jgi:hypothetical protein
MVVESRAGRIAALAAIVIALSSVPGLRSSLARVFCAPGYDDRSFVTVDRDTIHHNSRDGTVRPSVMELWRKQAQSFASFFPLQRWTSPEGVHTERVSEGLIENTGVRPWRGHLLAKGAEREALASFEWAQGDPTWVGRKVRLGYGDYRITGIMPPHFRLLSQESALWLPLPVEANNLEFIARLKPGATPTTARAELRELSRKAHHWGTHKLEVVTLRSNRQDDFWFPLSVLQWNLLFVLLVICRGWIRFLRLEPRPIKNWRQARFLGLLLPKTALLLSPLILVWILFVDPTVQQYFTIFAGWSIPVFFWFYVITAAVLTAFSLNDQQNRCPVCLHHLRMPVGRGSWSSLVIDRPATESICTYGHGTLYVPGTHLLNLDSVNWKPNREMWQQLAV